MGNVNMKCGVCMSDGLVQRLHPCGYLLGARCLASTVGKKCPVQSKFRVSWPIPQISPTWISKKIFQRCKETK